MCPLRAAIFWALLFAPACAIAPKPEPQPQDGAARAMESRVPAERQEIVPAQFVVGAGPIAVPPQIMVAPRPIVVPVPGSLPGPVPLVVLPDEQRELLERGELPESMPKAEGRGKPGANRDSQRPAEDAPPGTDTAVPKVDPFPVVVKPEPLEKEPEEAATRRTRRTTRKPAPMPRPPEVSEWPKPGDWTPGPDKTPYGPCFWKGTSGPGPFQPKEAPPDWITCIYQCGKYQVILHDIRGKSEDACRGWVHLKRAEQEARNFHGLKQKGR